MPSHLGHYDALHRGTSEARSLDTHGNANIRRTSAL